MKLKNIGKKIMSCLMAATVIATLFSTAIFYASAEGVITIDNLKTESLKNPLGIDVEKPIFSWQMSDGTATRGQKQTAYQIVVKNGDNETVWDTGKVVSDQSNNIEYGGSTLTARTRYNWTVTVWDQNDVSYTSQEDAWFETALLADNDFYENGVWLTRPAADGTSKQLPAPLFRKEFNVDTKLLVKSIKSARLYATAAGVYDVYLNGQRVGDSYLNPGRTVYKSLLYYQTYDVTDLLKSGDNAIGVVLGHGWWDKANSSTVFGANGEAAPLAFVGKLVITYSDGTTQTVNTDNTWKYYNDGPIRDDSIFDGEKYDATKMPGEWTSAGYDYDSYAWQDVTVTTAADEGLGEIVAQNGPLTKVLYTINPVSVKEAYTLEASNTEYKDRAAEIVKAQENGAKVKVYDFGQNIAGIVRIKVKGTAGSKITLRHGEQLNWANEDPSRIDSNTDDAPGTLWTKNLYTNYPTAGAKQEDSYILSGNGVETFEATLVYHGFQYMQLSGADRYTAVPDDVEIISVEALVLGSELEETGTFESSNANINKLEQNTKWSLIDNFLSVPTDCPQRNERIGWTGDAQFFARTASYLMNVNSFMAKYMEDIKDSSNSNGNFPGGAPGFNVKDPIGGWSEAGIVIPYQMWQQYGDTSFITNNYAEMKKYVDLLLSNAMDTTYTPEYIDRPAGTGDTNSALMYGDWLAVEHTPYAITETAFAAYSTKLFSEMAAAVGNDEDAAKYSELFEKYRAAWNKEFVDPQTGKTICPTSYKYMPNGQQNGKSKWGTVYGYNDDGTAKDNSKGTVTLNGETYDIVNTQCSYILGLRFGLFNDDVVKLAAENLHNKVKSDNYNIKTGFAGVSYILPVLADYGYVEDAYNMLEKTTQPSWLWPVVNGATTIYESWNGYTEVGTGPYWYYYAGSLNHYSYGTPTEYMYRYILGIDTDSVNTGFKHSIIRPTTGGTLTYAKGSYNSVYGKIVSNWEKTENGATYEFTVPANTTATVYLPREIDKVYTESGVLAQNSNGVTLVDGDDAEEIVYNLESGTYTFVLEDSSTKTYKVSNSSPAIPMFVDKYVNLNNVAVQFTENGKYIIGSAINWTADESAVGIECNSASRRLTAGAVGKWLLKAEYDGLTKNVWVIVNNENDYNFCLVDQDFTVTGGYDLSSWKWAMSTSNTSTAAKWVSTSGDWRFAAPSTSQKYVSVFGNGGTGVYLYNAPILSDFEDYTISTDYKVEGNDGYVNSSGLFFKAGADFTAANGTLFYTTPRKGMYLAQRQFGVMGLGTWGSQSYASTEYSVVSAGVHSLTGDSWQTTLGDQTTDTWTSSYKQDTAYSIVKNGNFRNVNVKLSGNDLVYSLDGNTVLDTKADKLYKLSNAHYTLASGKPSNTEIDAATVKANIQTEAGSAIGFMVNGSRLYIQNLKVMLNDVSAETLPEMFNIEYFNITYSSPAIPMFVGKTVDLSIVKVQMEKGTASVAGSDVDWNIAESTTGISYNKTTKQLSAHKKGNYKLTASYNGITKNVWVVVNEENDYDFFLVNEDLTLASTFDSDNWMFAQAKTKNTATNALRKDVYYGYAKPNETRDYLGVMGDLNDGGAGFVLYNAPILSDFEDYTILSDYAFSTNGGYSFSRGLVFKANANFAAANGEACMEYGDKAGMYLAQRQYGFAGIGQLGKTSYASNEYGFVRAGITSLSGEEWKNTLGNQTASETWVSKYNQTDTTYSIGNYEDNYRKVSVKLTSNDIIYSLDGEEVLNTTKPTYTLTGAQYALDTGKAQYKEISNATIKSYVKTEGGNAIGFVADSGWLRAKTLQVKLNDITAESMPEQTDYVFDAAIPVNTRIYLGSIAVTVNGTKVSGNEISWQTPGIGDADYSTYEISDNYLNVYKCDEQNPVISLKGTYNGKNAAFKITTANYGADTAAPVQVFAPSGITVKPLGDKNYSFTVSDNAYLVPGTLKATDSVMGEYSMNSEGDTGKVYSAYIYSASTMSVDGEFVQDENELLYNTYTLGASINPSKSAIKFVSSIPAIRRSGESIDLINTEVTYGGKQVTIVAAGALVVPSAIIGNNTDALKVQGFELTDETVSIPGYTEKDSRITARNVVIEKLNKATENYSNASVALYNIPDDMKDIDIAYAPYLRYFDGENYGYIYTDVTLRSYNGVMKAAYPVTKTTTVSNIAVAGTNHDFDNDASSDDISYALNEKIEFVIKLKGAYTIEHSMHKDTLPSNLSTKVGGYADETAYYNDSSNMSAETTFNKNNKTTRVDNYKVSYDAANNTYFFTTDRKTAGAVLLKAVVKDIDGNNVMANDAMVSNSIDMTVLVDSENVTQALEVGTKTDALVGAAKAKYTEWKSNWDAQFNSVIALKNSNGQTLNEWLATDDSKQTGAVFSASSDGKEQIRIEFADKSASAAAYRFIIATDAEIGTETNGANYDKFRYTDSTIRPSTGFISIPLGSTPVDIKGVYQGYGNNPPETKAQSANKIEVYMNSHGYDPKITSVPAGSKLSSTNEWEGGIGAFMQSRPGDGTPENIYNYGIIRRDYTALQLAKSLVNWNGENILTTGVSMGAWQSVLMAALDDKVNNTKIAIPWMCQVGAAQNGCIYSWHPVYDAGLPYFSTVTAARIINERVENGNAAYNMNIEFAGMADYSASAPLGVMALYNALSSDKAGASVTFYQFGDHGGTQTTQGTLRFKAVREKKSTVQ